MKYRIVNFNKFQHFHDRKPPWIKVYRDLLDNIDWFRLSPMAGKSLINLWLLGSESFGNLPQDSEIAFRLRLNLQELDAVMKELIKFKFVEEGEYPLMGDDEMNMNERIRKTNGFSSRYVSNQTKMNVLVRDDHKCQVCSSTENLEFDHIIPVSKGGSSEADNLQLLCRSCNRSKRAKSHDEFATLKTGNINFLRSPETEIETETENKKIKTYVRFEEFWNEYPSIRKQNQKGCLEKWKAKDLDSIADKVIGYVKSMKQTKSWIEGYSPAPMTLINQERWNDSNEPIKIRKVWEGGI